MHQLREGAVGAAGSQCPYRVPKASVLLRAAARGVTLSMQSVSPSSLHEVQSHEEFAFL